MPAYFYVPLFFRKAAERRYLAFRRRRFLYHLNVFQAADGLLRALYDVSFFVLHLIQNIVSYFQANTYILCRFRIHTLQRGRLRAAALSVWFSCHFSVCFSVACAWLRRASARRTCLCKAHAMVPKGIF